MKYNKKSKDYMLTDDQLQELLEKSTIHVSTNSKTTQKHSKQKDGKEKNK
ncbi:hypothetical protein [Phocaeicola paurosaccharolyticus]|nr:hypothetical protein [Phocaeicola paurosaccharolyticus]